MTDFPFRSGSQQVNGCTVDRVLRASTCHMPDLHENLSPWSWGSKPDYGLEWFWCYEEDTEINSQQMPPWLLQLCIAARDTYGCNWLLLDPDGDEIPGLPIYDEPQLDALLSKFELVTDDDTTAA